MPAVKQNSEMNIYQKLAKIRKNVEVLNKNASGYGYKYVSEDVILEKVTGLMDKYGLPLIPSIVPGSTQVRPYHYAETKAKKDGDRVHDLRHTFAVNSIIAGDDIKTLQENMGHYSSAFTLDRYGHVTEIMRKKSAERMQNFIENMGAPKAGNGTVMVRTGIKKAGTVDLQRSQQCGKQDLNLQVRTYT